MSTGFLLTSLAFAAPNDKKANELSEEALFNDYLNLRFDDAEEKLTQAISLCQDGCSSEVGARMHRDLGVVYIAGRQDRTRGIEAFVLALQVDPEVKLDPDLSTPEIESAFEEAKGQAASLPSPGKEPSGSGAPLDHSTPKEQTLSTPIPLFVRVGNDELIVKVTALVRGFGMSDYKEVELQKTADGFGGQTSCDDVGGTAGEFQYYIVAKDAEGRTVGQSGSADEPNSVTIKRELDGEAPSLPGEAPPEACAESAADCPPDFPGCDGNSDGWGDSADAPAEGEEEVGKRHWFSLSFQSDLLLLPAADDTCSRERLAWECFYPDGTFRNPTINQAGYRDAATGEWRGAGSTQGGFTFATMRILLGYDFALTESFRIGTRLGFAFGGRPQLITTDINAETGQPEDVTLAPFIPVHAEARLAYWFGNSTSVVRPHLGLSGGLAQIDGKLVAEIVDSERANSATDCPRDATGMVLDSRCSLDEVEAWRSTGPLFGAASAGLMIPFGNDHGVDLEAKFLATFPNSGLGAAIQAGYIIGL